jgi:hypothetical protein
MGTLNCIAPPGVPLQLWSIQAGAVSPKIRTDDNGEVHGITFRVAPGNAIYYVFYYEMEDKRISLNKMGVNDRDKTFWQSNETSDSDHQDPTPVPPSSIGSQTAPKEIHVDAGRQAVALFFMSVFYELSAFLFHILGGSTGLWKGFNEEITMYMSAIGGTSYSWPVGSVNIHPNDHWDRATIVHETSHQIMWQEADIGSATIAKEYLVGSGKMVHYTYLLYSKFEALSEGWAEFWEAMFSPPSAGLPPAGDCPVDSHNTPPYLLNTGVEDKSEKFLATHSHVTGSTEPAQINLMPPYDGAGEWVEGAFANGVWQLFKEYVANGDGHVVEAHNDYKVTAANSWVSDPAMQLRFQATIWAALVDLKGRDKTTSNFLDKIRTMNPFYWPVLATYLQPFNMVVASVRAGSIPFDVPATGGPVAIHGANFVNGMQLLVNAAPVPVTVTESQLDCIIPPAAGMAPGTTKQVSVVLIWPLKQWSRYTPFSAWTVTPIPLLNEPLGCTYRS